LDQKAKAFGYEQESKCKDQKLRLSATSKNQNVFGPKAKAFGYEQESKCEKTYLMEY
jgi:hypothetical protein